MRQADVARDGRDIGLTRIVVDGRSAIQYDTVINRNLDIWAAVSVDRLLDRRQYHTIYIGSEDTDLQFPREFGTRRYKLTIPYTDPQSPMVVNQGNSPIALCNARLSALSGAARQAFLQRGATIPVPRAYRIRAGILGGGNEQVEAPVTAHVECRALGRPRPRTETSTAGAPSRPGQRREPPAPTATPDRPMRANSRAADFDIRIRRVDRDGPGGATRLWLYNAGPDTAPACTVTARAGSAASWQTVATTDVAARQTLELDAPMPTGANLNFIVACIGEPESKLENNTAALP
ncbi:hypothetical protein FHS79_000618 [Polymorphobacter multimanifer]|uniref:Uncharacterized protein n=1 Tax=Polymorphobacter multimanifer TaxID=1070431 RepID=A0A841L4S2_9SPHN|nr:hypothetical protein [Polymorphobacter multimanifer]MBB6226461.1 hypothetical protein [Polymorphobacter multimanifer]